MDKVNLSLLNLAEMALLEQPPPGGDRLSRAAAHRLSLYLRVIDGWPSSAGKVSSGRIAYACGVSDAQVRRDLASLGHLGRRGLGYDPADLILAIRRALGIDRTWRAVLVGVGNLARALLRYKGFQNQGFEIVGLFDNDPRKLGEIVDGLTISAISELPQLLPELRAELAVITVPAESAQLVADMLATAGAKGVLNFAPVLLKLPSEVKLVTVDLAIQIEQLAFLIHLGDVPDVNPGLIQP